MANNCYSTYRLIGNPEDLDTLYELMTSLENEKENGNWVGHIVEALGGCDGLYVRGWWSFLSREEDHIEFQLESAWEPLFEAWDFIGGKFNLDVYFMGEEPGCEVFLKRANEERGWFLDNYYLDACLPDTREYIQEYFITIDSALRYIEKMTGTNIFFAEDIEMLNIVWNETSEDAYIYLHEFKEV